MATLLYPGKEFRITHQEMIKGIRKGSSGINYRYVIKQWGLARSKSPEVWLWKSLALTYAWAEKSVAPSSLTPTKLHIWLNPSFPKIRTCYFTSIWILFFGLFQYQRQLLWFDLKCMNDTLLWFVKFIFSIHSKSQMAILTAQIFDHVLISHQAEENSWESWQRFESLLIRTVVEALANHHLPLFRG